MADLQILQINLQHSTSATSLIGRQMAMGHTDITLIQEPWVHRGNVKGLDGAGIIYCCPNTNPRACICVSKQLNAQLIPEFCFRDLVAIRTCLVKDGRKMNLVVCSAYLPYDSPNPPPTEELENLVNYCKDKRLPLLIGCDANAHHTVWGSSDVNARGRELLEYLSTTDLEILNRGSSPTFVTSRRQEVIDLTLGSLQVTQWTKNWRVVPEPSLSDHRYIRFSLELQHSGGAAYRNPKSTDWAAYKAALSNGLQGVPNNARTIQEVEERLGSINTAVTTSFESSCPLRRVKRARKVPWWNSELQNQRKETRRLLNRAMRTNSIGDWDCYKQAQRNYKDSIRRSKRESWKAFCLDIEGLPEVARLHKALSKNPRARLECLRLPSGDHTATDEETLRHLLEVHFPGSVAETGDVPPVRAPRIGISPMDWEIASKVVTHEKIRWAICTFDPYKSPGPDGIFPALLQEGLDLLIRPLYNIFRTCLAFGYTPLAWRSVTVVFIPKAGRTTFDLAKSFRPISLTSFLLKTVERMVDRYIRDGALTIMPLHPNQHAYQMGKSVESALHTIVFKIEKALEHKELALGTFLDIEGAFDNTAFESICTAATNHGIETTIVRWMKSMLENRNVTATLNEDTVRVTVRRGCPQGGVLSPLMWSLVIDGLLRDLNRAGIYTQGYADDLAILIRGKFPHVICEVTQRALRTVERWCIKHGLAVNPDKTELVLFTRKRRIEGFTYPLLFGTPLRTAGKVKYLGVILDAKLTWREHSERQIQRATASFWMCRRTFGNTWGLKPNVIMWMYTAVIRPLITYAALVWWPRTTLASAKQRLGQLQRLACLGVTGAMRTAPTTALEALLGLVPLHLMIEAEARRAAYRLKCGGQWTTAGGMLGHTRVLSNTAETHVTLSMRSDRKVPSFSFNTPYTTVLPSREDWNTRGHGLLTPKGLVWFTDGSRTRDGSGAGVYGESPRVRLSFPLGRYATVFQAEVFAILACAYENLERGFTNKHIYICSDSQAALLALKSFRVSSELVSECRAALTRLCMQNSVKLLWVPGHSNIDGNEEADQLARQGSNGDPPGPEPILGIPYCNVKQKTKEWVLTRFFREWSLQQGPRQAKLLIGEISLRTSKELLKFSKKQIRIVTGLLTGHCHLNKHLHRIGIINDPICRLCREEEESSQHILCQCVRLMTLRHKHFGSAFLEPEEVRLIPVGRVLAFAVGTGLFRDEV